MKIKTKGKCPKCNRTFEAAQAESHLLTCTLQGDHQSSGTEGYLIRISGSKQPNMYWIFATIPTNAFLSLLDSFLRAVWLECCGHLSEFTIGDNSYFSYSESKNRNEGMKKRIGQLLTPGSTCHYVYDMGSSTHLEIQVLEKIDSCERKEVTILMQNEPPVLPCESCKKTADVICSICGNATCAPCSKKHACVVEERDDYMLLPLTNSPRAGVCAYQGF